jgi:hypothetical protein
MKIDKLFCDGCGNGLKAEELKVGFLIITEIRSKLDFKGNEMENGSEVVKIEKHFCEKCSSAIDQYIENDFKKDMNYTGKYINEFADSIKN